MKIDFRFVVFGGLAVILVIAALVSGIPGAVTSETSFSQRWSDQLIGTWDWGADNHAAQLFNFQSNQSFSFHEQGEALVVVSGTWEVINADKDEAHLKLISHNDIRPELDFYFTLIDNDHLQMRTSTETSIGLSFTRHGADPIDTHVDDGHGE
jgi:hypothetical protein